MCFLCFLQDFVLYIMAGHTHVFGRKPTMREREKDRERERKGKRPLKVETFLSAPDMLARHLLVRRDSAVPDAPSGQGRSGPQTTLVLNPGHTPVMFADLNKQKSACKIGSLFHICLHLSKEVTIPYYTLTPDFTVFPCPQSTSRDPTTRHFLIPPYIWLENCHTFL